MVGKTDQPFQSLCSWVCCQFIQQLQHWFAPTVLPNAIWWSPVNIINTHRNFIPCSGFLP